MAQIRHVAFEKNNKTPIPKNDMRIHLFITTCIEKYRIAFKLIVIYRAKA